MEAFSDGVFGISMTLLVLEIKVPKAAEVAPPLNLAGALLEKGRFDDAIPHFEKALAANPGSTQLHFYLGRLLATHGKFDEAIPHLEKAWAGGDPAIGGMLAAVYAQVGRLSDALATARKALQVARERNQQELVRTLNGSVASYEAALGTPARP